MRKRRLCSALLAGSLALGSLSGTSGLAMDSAAATGLSYQIDSAARSVTITRCDIRQTGTVEVPASIEGFPVETIAAGAFHRCEDITALILPDSVKTIGDSAFSEMDSLRSVTLPSGLTALPDGAFRFCESLPAITLPAALSSIGGRAFEECEALRSISVDSQNPYLTVAADSTVRSKDGHILYAYPMGLPLSDYAFDSTVTTVAAGAFAGCKTLRSVTVPSNVTQMGAAVFAECTALASADFSQSSLNAIADETFYECESLRAFSFPGGAASVGARAFADCGFTELAIPASITEIGALALSDCSALTAVTFENPNLAFPMTNGVYDSGVVSNDTNDTATAHTYSGVIRGEEGSTAQAYANREGYRFSALSSGGSQPSVPTEPAVDASGFRYIVVNNQSVTVTEYTLGGGEVYIPSVIAGLPVTAIAAGTFGGSGTVPLEIHIPASVETIEPMAFSSPMIEEIDVADRSAFFRDEDDALFTRNMETLVRYPSYAEPDEDDTVYYVPSSVTRVESGAFYQNQWLTEVILPQGVSEFGALAMSGMARLRTLTLPESVVRIPGDTFTNNPNLSKVTIRSAVCVFDETSSENVFANTADGAFSGTIAAQEGSTAQAYAAKTATSFETLGDTQSGGNGGGGSASGVLPQGLSCSLNYEKTGYIVNLTGYRGTDADLVIPGEINGLPVVDVQGEIEDNATLRSVTFPGSARDLDFIAFENCRALQTVTVCEGTVSLQVCLFENCPALETVSIPATMLELLCGAEHCPAFRGFTVSADNPVYFTDESGVLFMDADKPQSLYPDMSGKVLWNYPGALTAQSYTAPDDITAVGPGAFAGNTALREVTLPQGCTALYKAAFADCTALREVTLPDSLTRIYDACFENCPALGKITIPAGVEQLPPTAFEDCPLLKELTVLNPGCAFSDAIREDYYDLIEDLRLSGTVIRAPRDSAMQTFAQTNGLPFEVYAVSAALLGDINGDGELTVSDAVLLARLQAEDKSLGAALNITEEVLAAADVDQNGEIALTDVSLLMGLL